MCATAHNGCVNTIRVSALKGDWDNIPCCTGKSNPHLYCTSVLYICTVHLYCAVLLTELPCPFTPTACGGGGGGGGGGGVHTHKMHTLFLAVQDSCTIERLATICQPFFIFSFFFFQSPSTFVCQTTHTWSIST